MKISFARIKASLFWLILLLLGIFSILQYENYISRHPKTDNAYLGANQIPISAQITGPIKTLYVHNHQHVAAGAKLFRIDPTPFRFQVAQAQAQLAIAEHNIASAHDEIKVAQARIEQASSQYDLAQKKAKRVQILSTTGKVSKELADEAQSGLLSASAAFQAALSAKNQAIAKMAQDRDSNAYVKAARAQLALAQLNLAHTVVYAPHAGTISQLSLRPGQMVTATQPIFVLVEDDHWWVDANFKETQIEYIHPGQSAKITLDMYPDKVFEGQVESISIGSGAAFSLFPPENATGNWIKVTQRFPIRIRVLQAIPEFPFRMGASCEVQIRATQ